MRSLPAGLQVLSRSTSYLLGTAVILLAIGSASTALQPMDILEWLQGTLGWAFLAMLAALVVTAIVCWVNLLQSARNSAVWLEGGLHAAAGIATLALTYTLLGICLGIGSLAEQPLTPETVQTAIAGLTQKFSLAFFTTVIGLPLSSALRALLLVTHAARLPQDGCPQKHQE